MPGYDTYDPEKEGTGFESELLRLEAQAKVSWKIESRRLQRLGVTDGLRLLELGCGPGFVTRLLCQLLPNSAITALDINPRLLAHGRQYLSDCVPNVEFVEAPVTETGLPSDEFELAFSRYLFQHLTEPVAAAREVLRVLKPGGRHLIIDVDDILWGIAEPAFPSLQAIYTKGAAIQERQGRDRHVGRRLWHILNVAGYVNVELDLFCYHSDELGLEPFLPQMDPSRLLPLVGDGGISTLEFITAHFLYQQFLSAPGAYVMMVGFIACGTKPI